LAEESPGSDLLQSETPVLSGFQLPTERMTRTISAVLLLVCALGCSGASVDKNRPVSKVLTLLKDMVGQLEEEAQSDEKVKEEMDCWCETGLVDKTQAISDNNNKIGRLNSAIEGGASNSARLSTEIATLEKEVAENTEALEKATAMRQKELAEFSSDEKSMLGSIGQMKNAVETIGAKHDGSAERASSHHRTGVQEFLQVSTSASENAMLEVMAALHTQLRRRADLVTSAQREAVTAFVESSGSSSTGRYSLLQQGAEFSPAHSSSSGGILGVLKGMKESFETNLAASQKEEETNQGDYESLKKAKTDEINAGTDLADKKSTEKGNTDQKHAQDSQDLEDTERTLAADTDFLKNLKEQCVNVDAEYAERVKTRNQEITATSKALAYLNSDDAQDLYSRTFSFVQESSTQTTERRTAGCSVLAAAAARAKDPRLSALAVRARNPQDAFEKVTESIQDMIDKLVTEKEEEVKHKDYCVDGIQKNEADTQHKNTVRDDHKYAIAELTSEIGTLTKEIAELNAEIDASHVSLKRAGEDRHRQNTEFQKTVADQRATAKLLAGALDILKGFYDKASLAQRASSAAKAFEPAGAPPPPGFKKREGASSGGVMGMIEQIIKDAEAMEAEAISGEEESQTGYESFVTELNASIVDMQKSIVHKTETKASKAADKAQKEIELEGVEQELDELKSANEDLHGDCDYTLKNFDKKQGARDDEITALKESVSIFAGGSFASLLQSFKH